MMNRFLLIGAGVVLGLGLFAFTYFRDAEAARANPETVLSLSPEELAAQKEDAELEAKPTVASGTVIYACADGHAFAVTYSPERGRAALTLDGDTIMMDAVYVSDGVQFTDGQYSFRAQGEVAAIVLGDDVLHESCHVRHEAQAANTATETH